MIAIVPVVAAASKPVHRCSWVYSDSRCGRAGTAFVGEQNRGRAKPQTNRASNEVRRSHLDAAALLPCCPAALPIHVATLFAGEQTADPHAATLRGSGLQRK